MPDPTSPWAQHYHGLSPRAQKTAREAAARQLHVAAQRRRMLEGPYLAPDQHTLIVPSDWYCQEAHHFWKRHGFHWNAGDNTWERDTHRPLHGHTYPTHVWLERTRAKFYEFWPNLMKTCTTCGAQFAATNAYQTQCPECQQATERTPSCLPNAPPADSL